MEKLRTTAIMMATVCYVASGARLCFTECTCTLVLHFLVLHMYKASILHKMKDTAQKDV
jgi:hypothetical protein